MNRSVGVLGALLLVAACGGGDDVAVGSAGGSSGPGPVVSDEHAAEVPSAEQLAASETLLGMAELADETGSVSTVRYAIGRDGSYETEMTEAGSTAVCEFAYDAKTMTAVSYCPGVFDDGGALRTVHTGLPSYIAGQFGRASDFLRVGISGPFGSGAIGAESATSEPDGRVRVTWPGAFEQVNSAVYDATSGLPLEERVVTGLDEPTELAWSTISLTATEEPMNVQKTHEHLLSLPAQEHLESDHGFTRVEDRAAADRLSDEFDVRSTMLADTFVLTEVYVADSTLLPQIGPDAGDIVVAVYRDGWDWTTLSRWMWRSGDDGRRLDRSELASDLDQLGPYSHNAQLQRQDRAKGGPGLPAHGWVTRRSAVGRTLVEGSVSAVVQDVVTGYDGRAPR